jgi:hypothetical protein
LLTLLKQARAFGVGIVLATQNPVDIDYKGLSNIGTWLIGRLQTDRDKSRLLDGLEGAAAGSLNREDAAHILSKLPKRVFLLHNVHDPRPVVFQTRWSLSYLRGPMSREQIRELVGPKVQGSIGPEVHGSAGPAAQTAPSHDARTHGPVDTQTSGPTDARTPGPRPVLPPGIDQYFLPDPAAGKSEVAAPEYVPVILGAARAAFTDAKLGIDESRDVFYAAPIENGPVPVDWQNAQKLDLTAGDLQREPASTDATFSPLLSSVQQPKNYAAWQKSFSQWLARNERIELLRHRETKLTSRPGEDERDFKARLQDARRSTRDEEVEAIRRKYAAKRDTLVDRRRRALSSVEREQQQASDSRTQTMLSFGAAAIGAMLGKKVLNTGTLGRATTAARGVGRSMKEAGDVKRATENVAALDAQIQELDDLIKQDTQQIVERFDAPVEVERISLTPKRGQVAVQFVALGWDPR